MPAAAPRPLLRSLPMAVAVLALLLPAAPALAQALVTYEVIGTKEPGEAPKAPWSGWTDPGLGPWEGVTIKEGGAARFTFTADPAPTTQAEEIPIGGSWVRLVPDENGVLRESTAGYGSTVGRFPNNNKIGLELGQNSDNRFAQPFRGSFTDNTTCEGPRTLILRVNRNTVQSNPYKVDEASSGSRDLTITITDEDDCGDPDVNASGSVDANDALILYYAYSLRNDLGTGR